MSEPAIEIDLELAIGDATCDGLLYRPDRDDPAPGVIHLTDIGGIRPAHNGMAQRLAERGYAVLVPNVFYRTRKPPMFDFERVWGEPRTARRFAELADPLTADAMDRDVAAYVDALAARGDVADGPVGVVGYCFTGRMALRAAAARPERVAAAASFHGGWLATDGPDSAHRVLDRVKARLYFAHAIEDGSMPEPAIAELERALEAWGGTYESEVYDGARHGWTAPDSAIYAEAQAERAFTKLVELFDATLRDPTAA